MVFFHYSDLSVAINIAPCFYKHTWSISPSSYTLFGHLLAQKYCSVVKPHCKRITANTFAKKAITNCP